MPQAKITRLRDQPFYFWPRLLTFDEQPCSLRWMIRWLNLAIYA